MWRAAWGLTAAILLVAGSAPPAGAASGTVHYLSASSVYLDVGRADGLVPEAIVWVERGRQRIAKLQVEFVAQHSAACRILESSSDIQIGDSISYTAVAAPEAPPPTNAAAPAGPPGARGPGWDGVWSQLGRVRGRIATLYTRSTDPDGTYSNPSMMGRLRWTGRGKETLRLRFRADRPAFETAAGSFSSASGTGGDLRVFELQARYRDPSGALELEAGRLLPRRLELLGYMDGAGVAWSPRSNLRLGAALGWNAQVGVSGLADQGFKLGTSLDWSRRAGARALQTTLAMGLIQDPDVVRRSFIAWRTSARLSRTAALFQSVEIDLNPTWKRSLGEGPLGLTSWSLSGQMQVDPQVSLLLGIDARRSLLVPELLQAASSLDLRRQVGLYGSTRIDLSKVQSLRVGGDLRLRGPGGTSSSWDLSLYRTRLFGPTTRGHFDINGYFGSSGSGYFLSGALAWRPAVRFQGELAAGTGGTRTQGGGLVAAENRTQRAHWLRTTLDVQLGRGVWANLSSEYRSASRSNEWALELGRVF